MRAVFALLVGIFSTAAFANESSEIEIQQYPVGTILDVGLRTQLSSHMEGHLRLGANLAYHGNRGVQNAENGVGFGVIAGLRYQPEGFFEPFYVGLRTAIWRMSIRWENTSNPALGTFGDSRFWVLQPSLEFGRDFEFPDSPWGIAVGLGLGYEINAFVDGAPTGQGGIGLVSLALFRQE